MTPLQLLYGSTVLATVVPDDTHPNMWRVVWPDGQQSDMVNLARAKDAAAVIAERGPPARDHRLLRWRRLDHFESHSGGRPRVKSVSTHPTTAAPAQMRSAA